MENCKGLQVYLKVLLKNKLLVIVKTRDLEKYNQVLLIEKMHHIGSEQKQPNKGKTRRKHYSLLLSKQEMLSHNS